MNKAFPLSLIAIAVSLNAQTGYSEEQSQPGNTAPTIPASATTAIEEIIVEGEALSAVKTLRIKPDIINQPDSAAVLKALPGANINSNGPITGIAQYRGLFGDRVAVTMENEAVLGGGPNAMDTPLSYAPPLLLKSIALSPGIASVSDSQESIGGLIQAELDRGNFAETRDATISGDLATRYGSIDDGSNSAAKVIAANNQHKLAILASFDEGSDAETGDGKTLRDSGYQRERYDLSYGWQNDASEAEVSLGKLETSNTGTPSLPMDIIDIDTDMANFNGATQLNGATLRTRMGYRHVYHLMDNFSLRSNSNNMSFRATEAIGQQFTWGASLEFPIGDDSLTLGIDSAETIHDAVITNPNNPAFRVQNFADAERDIYGFFSQWRGMRGDWELEAGVRYNHVDMDSGEVSVTGGMPAGGQLANDFNNANRDQNFDNIDIVLKASRPLNDSTDFNIGLGRKNRAPSYQELYLWLPMQSTGGLADGRTYIGNLDLDSETNHEITLGLDWSAGDFYANGQIFFRKVDDFIQGTPSTNTTANMLAMMMGGQAPLQFNNIDAELYGLDGRYGMLVNDNWRLDGVLSYVRGEDTDNNDNLYRLAPLNNRLTLTWEQDKLSANLESVLYASQSKTASYNDEQKSAGYGLLNFYSQYQISSDLRINAGIENLLDKDYVDHLTGYNRNGDSDIAVGDRLPGRGRNFFVSVALSL
ncbi:MAG: TonB-dependent receptor [Gammaproteobacteria bacterium]|nr:TonB-dependent receptor [Gammaproteobacteria bacterium]MBQ0840422.1 TonB-dependent receptor [Gammaproteobacteria bacterium]